MTVGENAQSNIVGYDVTCILISYNQEAYIQDALEGLFSATTGNYNVEYILSDDGSTDATPDIIQEFLEERDYLNLKNVHLIKNNPNLGLIPHLNNVLSIAKGEVFILCAGDDICGSSRIIDVLEGFKDKKVSLINSDAYVIDQTGKSTGRLYGRKKTPPSLKSIFRSGHVNLPGAGNAIHRDVFHAFGDLPEDVENEDDQLPVRALLLNGIGIINKPLFYYRMHSESLSAWLWRSEFTISQYYERYSLNFINRYRHYNYWLKMVEDCGTDSEYFSWLEKRVKCFKLLSSRQGYYQRLIALKYSHVLDPFDKRVVLFGIFGAWFNLRITEIKRFLKFVISTTRA